MKLRITLLSLFAFSFGATAQVTPELQHNNLDYDFLYEYIFDIEVHNNYAYYSLPVDGLIVKINLAAPNQPPINVVSGLTSPTGLAFVGDDLYFLQATNGSFEDNAGKLCKVTVTDLIPTVTILHSTLQYPMELEMNGTTAYISEEYHVGDEVEHMELSVVVDGTKTVLYDGFEYLDDIEFYNNKLYLLNWTSDINFSTIKTLDVTTNTPGTPQSFWSDATEIFPYKMEIGGNKLYLNMDASPASLMSLDLLNPTAPLELVADEFTFNGNTAYINEMIVTEGNVLYALADSYVPAEDADNLLMYKVDLNLLGSSSFEPATALSVYPNPATGSISISNYDAGRGFEVYSLEGKQVMKGAYNGTISLDTVASGMYIVKLDNGKAIKVQKV